MSLCCAVLCCAVLCCAGTWYVALASLMVVVMVVMVSFSFCPHGFVAFESGNRPVKGALVCVCVCLSVCLTVCPSVCVFLTHGVLLCAVCVCAL